MDVERGSPYSQWPTAKRIPCWWASDRFWNLSVLGDQESLSLPVSIAFEFSARELSERLWRRDAHRRPARAVLSRLLLGAHASSLGRRRNESSLDARTHNIGFG